MEEYWPRAREDASLPDVLLRARLLDELLLCTHPAILGFGGPLFDEYDMAIELDLLEQRSFEQGVTMHRYAIRDVSEASPC
jgi:dihydrofolate reductase